MQVFVVCTAQSAYYIHHVVMSVLCPLPVCKLSCTRVAYILRARKYSSTSSFIRKKNRRRQGHKPQDIHDHICHGAFRRAQELVPAHRVGSPIQIRLYNYNPHYMPLPPRPPYGDWRSAPPRRRSGPRRMPRMGAAATAQPFTPPLPPRPPLCWKQWPKLSENLPSSLSCPPPSSPCLFSAMGPSTTFRCPKLMCGGRSISTTPSPQTGTGREHTEGIWIAAKRSLVGKN